MPMKDWLYRLRPVQLYIVLVLSIAYFLAQLFLSHITHALTLLVDSYHMLCNIIALSGCILTIKHSNRSISYQQNDSSTQSSKEESHFVEVCVEKQQQQQQQQTIRSHNHELKLKNTFGWTRIDVLTMLIVCIFLASLSFSLLVEALQTLIHIDHQDTMHLPIPILTLGGIGLILNGLCYLLIGGYTLHQGSFLQITSSGNVILDSRITSSGECLKPGERRLSRTKRETQQQQQQQHATSMTGSEATITNEFQQLQLQQQQQQKGKRQGFLEMFRDISSTLFVICCAIIVYLADDGQVAKYVDPIISIFSCIVLLILSYPYMKESCFILLQTIPATIDIEIFKQTLLSTFTDIVSVHDLHIWQLTASRYVSTAHIIFQNPLVYARIMDDVKNFFHEQGITIVTIQPEFKSTKVPPLPEECLVQCSDITCLEKHCCQRQTTILAEIVTMQDQKKDKQIVLEQQQNQKQHKSKFESLFSKKNSNKTQSVNEKSKSTNNLNSNSSSSDTNESTTTTITTTEKKKSCSEPQLLTN